MEFSRRKFLQGLISAIAATVLPNPSIEEQDAYCTVEEAEAYFDSLTIHPDTWAMSYHDSLIPATHIGQDLVHQVSESNEITGHFTLDGLHSFNEGSLKVAFPFEDQGLIEADVVITDSYQIESERINSITRQIEKCQSTTVSFYVLGMPRLMM